MSRDANVYPAQIFNFWFKFNLVSVQRKKVLWIYYILYIIYYSSSSLQKPPSSSSSISTP